MAALHPPRIRNAWYTDKEKNRIPNRKNLVHRNLEKLFMNSINSETSLCVVTLIPITESSTNRIAQCGVRSVFLLDCEGSDQ